MTRGTARSPMVSWRAILALLVLLSFMVQWKLLLSSHHDDRDEAMHFAATLPEALHPVTFPKCCDGREESFFSTCFAEKACNSSVYPFRSEREAMKFEYWSPQSRQELDQHNESCRQANLALSPPTTWCQIDNNETISLQDLSFPMGCSWYTMEGGSGPYDRMILFPQGKLAFCGIPKAGITQWLQFLRFTIGAKDYQSYPHQKPDVDPFWFDRKTRAVQQEVWTNWNKAVFIRNPAERLLSAYLDKIVKKPKGQRAGHKNMTFSDFVQYVANHNASDPSSGLSWYTDPHWRPQAWSCGLSEFLPQFQYVGSLDRAAHHTKTLLQKVNLWESYGKHYRVSRRKSPLLSRAAIYPPEPLKVGQAAPGFQQERMDSFGHHRHSQKKMDKYYTPALLEQVKRLYWMDYALWDAIQQAEQEDKVNGRDIAKKLKPDCDN